MRIISKLKVNTGFLASDFLFLINTFNWHSLHFMHTSSKNRKFSILLVSSVFGGSDFINNKFIGKI